MCQDGEQWMEWKEKENADDSAALISSGGAVLWHFRKPLSTCRLKTLSLHHLSPGNLPQFPYVCKGRHVSACVHYFLFYHIKQQFFIIMHFINLLITSLWNWWSLLKERFLRSFHAIITTKLSKSLKCCPCLFVHIVILSLFMNFNSYVTFKWLL